MNKIRTWAEAVSLYKLHKYSWKLQSYGGIIWGGCGSAQDPHQKGLPTPGTRALFFFAFCISFLEHLTSCTMSGKSR